MSRIELNNYCLLTALKASFDGGFQGLWVEAAGQRVAGGETDNGGTDCHYAAAGLCWCSVYLLQCWLGSQHGVCKVGQHIIYFPALLISPRHHAAPSLRLTSVSPHISDLLPFSPLSSPPV